MRLTRYTDYALRVLMYLGLQREGDLVTIKEMARRYGVSNNHLMKVVHQLGRDGYIETLRGRQGGVCLARPPETIGLGEVIRLFEEDLRLVECFDPEANTCPIAEVCALPAALDKALEAFLSVLDRYSLADLLAPRRGLSRVLSPPVRNASR